MRSFLLLFLTFFISAAFSQNKIFLSGTLKDSISNQPLLFASITNVNTRQTVLSDKKGVFKIAVSQNQLLSFASVGYNFDTVFINEKVLQIDTLHILLSPLTRSLAEVTVYSNMKLSAYQSDSSKRRKEFFQTISDHTLPVFSDGNSGSGIGLNLDRFYSKEKKKKKAIDLFDQIEQEQYINYRFTAALVSKYTSLSADSLSLFIQQYRPPYNWLRKHTEEEDVLYYINDKLKLFFKRKEN